MPATKTLANEPRNDSSNIALSMKLPRTADFEKALIRQYAKAVKLSRKAGHQVSFRVVVDPLAGAQTISVVEEEPLSHQDVFPVEEVPEPDDELQAALVAARERGRRRVAEILAEDDMLSAEAFADLLGVSRVTVNTKRQNGQVLGLDGAKRGFRFPSWQLDRDGRPYAALPKLHEVLGGAWAVYRFLVTPHGALDGRTGLDALKRGQDNEVGAAAESVARGDFR
jgi:nucleotide-binding universal stress UspA family protein